MTLDGLSKGLKKPKVLRMKHLYLQNMRAAQRKKLWRSLVPGFLLMLRKKIQYEKRFPDSFIDAGCVVDHGAQIGRYNVIREHCVIGNNVSIDDYTTVGLSCLMNGKGKINIGKFCSIGPDCLLWSENHIFDNVSTFPFEQFVKSNEQKYQEYEAGDITVGHDVWVGHRVMILAGANIGTGCVVAAGSVVPRGEYEPYSVIAGMPGKVIKKRLPDDKIEELLAMKWWDRDQEEIFGSLMPFLHKGD